MAIVVVSGPSGVGKSLVVKEVLAAIPALQLGVSLTTREPRPDDDKYRYVSRPEFEGKAKAGELLEWAEYSGNLYGTLRPLAGEQVLLEIEVKGAAQIKQQFPGAHLIFLVPPGELVDDQLKVLEERLRRRGSDDEAAIGRRLATATTELQQGRAQSDVVIVNDEIAEAVREVVAAVRTYLHKTS